MECFCATNFGNANDVLKYHKFEPDDDCWKAHVPRDNEVLIRIAYSDMNPVDLQKLSGGSLDNVGKEIPNGPLIPGYGGSGTILQINDKTHCSMNESSNETTSTTITSLVPTPTTTTTTTTTTPSNSHLAVGMRVIFLRDPSRWFGSYSSLIWVDARLVTPIPDDSITFQDAATIPVAGCTAYESLNRIGLGPNNSQSLAIPGSNSTSDHISTISNTTTSGTTIPTTTTKKKHLLVVGGAGGVGSWTILLAKAWWNPVNLKVIATASSTESQQWCSEVMGADQVIPGHNLITTTLGKSSVSHIICLTEPTSDMMESLSDVIEPYGTICFVVAGRSIQSINLGFCFYKAVTIVCETVFSSIRTNFNVFQPAQEMKHILEMIVSKQIKCVPLSTTIANSVDKTNNWILLNAYSQMFELLASGHVQGKLVLKIGDNSFTRNC